VTFLGLLLSTTALAELGGGWRLVQHLLDLGSANSLAATVPVPATNVVNDEQNTGGALKKRWLYAPPASRVKYHVREFLAAVLLLLKAKPMCNPHLQDLQMLDLLQYQITKVGVRNCQKSFDMTCRLENHIELNNLALTTTFELEMATMLVTGSSQCVCLCRATQALLLHNSKEQDEATAFAQGMMGVQQQWDIHPDILRRAGLPPGGKLTGEQVGGGLAAGACRKHD